MPVCVAGQALGYRPGVRLKHLALGQGMGPRAAEAVEAGAARGLWVLLQNCHLLPRWLPALEALLERLDRPHKAPNTLCSCAMGVSGDAGLNGNKCHLSQSKCSGRPVQQTTHT